MRSEIADWLAGQVIGDGLRTLSSVHIAIAGFIVLVMVIGVWANLAEAFWGVRRRVVIACSCEEAFRYLQDPVKLQTWFIGPDDWSDADLRVVRWDAEERGRFELLWTRALGYPRERDWSGNFVEIKAGRTVRLSEDVLDRKHIAGQHAFSFRPHKGMCLLTYHFARGDTSSLGFAAMGVGPEFRQRLARLKSVIEASPPPQP